jgi:UDP-glucuronate decarboxylase
MKTVLISGCAGFIGQNLILNLIKDYKVIGIDNFISSDRNNFKNFKTLKNFRFYELNIINDIEINEKIDYIFNLACPASPPKYQSHSIFTLETNFIGTHNLLKLANKNNSVFIQASTSEVYGDPEIHPQKENYNGNVNINGPRACYDVGKRIAETLCYEYRQKFELQTRVVRIFNTYGPGMDPDDGRVISNFLRNTLTNKPLVIYGDGLQTRSFCYVDDLIDALCKSMHIDFSFPINIGNDNEISLNELAKILFDKYGENKIIYANPNVDDPRLRKPDIQRAKEILKWSPTISINKGIEKTYSYFKKKLIIN